MRLLLIGAPGAGKGTQAERLAERFNITHISSGDLLRQHVRDQTSIGQTIKAYVDAGDLVPDSVVLDMLRKPVVAAAESGGYVLDGFPGLWTRRRRHLKSLTRSASRFRPPCTWTYLTRN